MHMTIELNVPIPDNHVTASEFVRSVVADRSTREDKALDVLLAGNVPSHMRSFVDVTFHFDDNDGVRHELTVRTLPDYLLIGTDDDSVRIPLWPLTAQKIADAWGCLLPTSKLVTEIWKAAPGKLPPEPWGPPYDSSMMSTARIVKHNERIETTIQRLNVDAKQLLAGHKKDVVLSVRLSEKPNNVAIFGWHQFNGKPIQPVSLVHENTYADYSHGIRMLHSSCMLDGVDDDLGRIYMDPVLSKGVSDEGPLPFIRQPKV